MRSQLRELPLEQEVKQKKIVSLNIGGFHELSYRNKILTFVVSMHNRLVYLAIISLYINMLMCFMAKDVITSSVFH